MLGGILALLSAATFGLNNAAVRRGVVTGSVLQGLVITVPIGVPIFLLCCALVGGLDALFGFSLETTLYLAAAGIVHFVIGRYGNYRGIQAMGGNLSGLVQQSSILITLLLAVILLGEFLTPLRLIGIALIFLGPIAMLPGRKRFAQKAARINFIPRYGEGFFFAGLAALGYGISPILVRAALENRSLGTSVAGGTISYIAATALIGIILLNRKQLNHALSIAPVAVRWFAFSGVFVCLSQVFRYMALAVAPVAIVAPILQLQVIFRTVFAWLLNREQEPFDVWVILGILLSLCGALAVSVSTDFVLNLIALPATLVDIAHWHWP
jgi:drug/metabolite transporter (DMT)-like permease